MPATGFHDVRFPVNLSLGATGGPEFKTDIATTFSGYEQRNKDWPHPRGRWDFARHVASISEHDLLDAFFRARGGRAYGFRFPVHDDFEANLSFFGTADGTTKIFPLFKHYTDNIGGGTLRRIVLPVNPDVYDTDTPFGIYSDLSLVAPTAYTVDWRNGRVSFNIAPANGAELRWSGEFDVPARFNTDHLRKNIIMHDKIGFEELPIVELLPKEVLESPDP